MEFLKIIFFIVILVTSILFFYYLRQTRIVSSQMKKAYTALDETAVKREREAKRNVLIRTKGIAPRKGISKYIEKAQKLYVYSRLGSIFNGLTFELFTIMFLISATLLYVVIYAVSKSISITIILVALYTMMIMGIEKILSFRNYRQVENNLLKFLDMLENFNATNGDIISILFSISRYLENPLRTVLEECYYEAHTGGDKTVALYSMMDKIEHPKFKEVICDIEICMKYSGNYSETLKQNRRNIFMERRSKRERRAMTYSLIINMILVTVAIVSIFSITEGLLEYHSCWHQLFYTPVGHVCITVMAVIYVYFFYKMYTAER